MTDRMCLSGAELVLLRDAHPALPDEYFTYLQEVGWGPCGQGRMMYSGPVSPAVVCGVKALMPRTLIVGADADGNFLAYDLCDAQWGEVQAGGVWVPWDDGAQSFASYLGD